MCVAFGKFLGVFFPSVSSTHWLWHIAHVPAIPVGPMVLGNMDIGVSTANLAGIVVVCVRGGREYLRRALRRSGAEHLHRGQGALAGSARCCWDSQSAATARRLQPTSASHWSQFWRNAGWASLHPVQVGAQGPIVMVNLLVILAVVQVGSLFSADAWNNVTFTAGEIKNPRRNVPLSLAFGVGFVLVVYFLASAAYILVLPLHGDPHGATIFARGVQYAAEDRIGAAVLQQIFPHLGGYLMAAAILISTFGCANGITLAGARAYYAMAQDGLFFRSVGKLHPRYKTPAAGLVVQAIWTTILCVSGSYSQLLDYIIFAVLVFYILTILGLFVLRIKQPDAPRPYKAFGYPFLPALYIVMATGICAALLRYKPQYTWPGLILVLLGVPVYLFWSRGRVSEPSESHGSVAQ